jgi:hypothetical protein
MAFEGLSSCRFLISFFFASLKSLPNQNTFLLSGSRLALRKEMRIQVIAGEEMETAPVHLA